MISWLKERLYYTTIFLKIAFLFLVIFFIFITKINRGFLQNIRIYYAI